MHNIGIAYYAALLLLVATTSTNSTKCSRIIEGITMSRSNAEGKYHFFMTLFNRSDTVYAYMPNTRYSVVLKADSSDQIHRKFTRFLISAEAENANETADVGTFDLQDDVMTKFADNCANVVIETSKVKKEQISVVWTSPTENSGCILIRATVLETLDTWYMDDPNLVLTMCQDSKAEADDQGLVLNKCCACEEAKYEVTFEGLWSRNTHPKDFPSKGWLIRFSDVIGASHTGDYRFWRYFNNSISNENIDLYKASAGVQQVAEAGTTRILESELKNQSECIRTIIKARGIAFPNVTGRTFAVFRVDQKHHLMSLISKIDPSPDWIVGVSGLELCLSNCSWINYKELNLYPYDAGTDDGITYISLDSPTNPHEPIRRITSTYPNDSRSPFYDPTGLDMKPLAKLYLNRQRLYEKTCIKENDTGVQADEGVVYSNKNDNNCEVTPWSEWSSCPVTCGRGYQLRQRRYRDEAATHNCNKSLTDRKFCYNAQSPHCLSTGRHDGLLDSEKCELTNWSSWSSCTSTCGEGSKTRYRNFRQKTYWKQCKIVPNGPKLQESIDCENMPCKGEDKEEVRQRLNRHLNVDDEDKDCADGRADREIIEKWLQRCPAEYYSEWSLWSPCSSSCGPGVQMRSRLHKDTYSGSNKDSDSHEECKVQHVSCTAAIPSCNLLTREEKIQICSEPKIEGHCSSNILRAHFDKQSGQCHLFKYSGCNGNRNNFQTIQDCINVCGNFQREDFKGIQAGSQIMESGKSSKVNCQVSEWSKWSHCERCRGYSISIRETIPPKGGGKRCPKKLIRRKKCNKIPPCSLQVDGSGRRFHRDKNTGLEEITVNCEVTPWSTWSQCSATCGESLRTRVRSVRVKPRGSWARLCPPLVEFKKCRRIDCPQ